MLEQKNEIRRKFILSLSALLLCCCSLSANFIISTTSTQVSCNGGDDGTLTAVAFGGTAPYQYNWSTGDTGSSVAGLPSGTYTVTVVDAEGEMQVQMATVYQPSALNSIVLTSDATCSTSDNGVATATVSYTHLTLPTTPYV